MVLSGSTQEWRFSSDLGFKDSDWPTAPGSLRRYSGSGRANRRAAQPDIATWLWHTGVDPFTKQEVYVSKGLKDRRMQRALMQFFKPENYFMVREALILAGRADLIGSGCDCLIPANPPREAIEARRRANKASRGEEVEGDHYHTVANPSRGEKPGERGLQHHEQKKGYRPGRKSHQRQQRKKRGR
jgi:hypothetical protein